VTPLEPAPAADAEAEAPAEETPGGGRPVAPVALGRAASAPRKLS